MNPAHQAASSRSQIGLACIANTEHPLSFLKDDFPLVRFSPDFIVRLLTSYTDAVVGLVKFSLCSLRAFRKGQDGGVMGANGTFGTESRM